MKTRKRKYSHLK